MAKTLKNSNVWPLCWPLWPQKVGQSQPLPSLCNIPSYYNIKFKWNPNKRHGENRKKAPKCQSLTFVTFKIRSRSTCSSLSLCNVPSYYYVKFKWNPNKRHEEKWLKNERLKKGQSLTSVTLKSMSRSTCFSSSLCNVLSYHNVKFKWNPNKRH